DRVADGLGRRAVDPLGLAAEDVADRAVRDAGGVGQISDAHLGAGLGALHEALQQVAVHFEEWFRLVGSCGHTSTSCNESPCGVAPLGWLEHCMRRTDCPSAWTDELRLRQ